MLTIRTTTGNHFDLFPGTKLSIEENSPMFSDAGSFSLPLELPETDNNLQILEYPHRADRRKRFITSLDVVITCGVWIRHARMDIESAGKRKNITTSLFFRESPFYQKIKNITLQDIFKDVVRDDFNDTADPVQSWINYLDQISCFDIIDHFHVFPVCSSIDVHEEPDGNDYLYRTTYYSILNRPDVPESPEKPGRTGVSITGKTYYRLAVDDKAYTDNKEYINVPKGYGITPFLKFRYILDSVFQFIEYSFDEDVYTKLPALNDLCFLNNTADAIVKGEIFYEQLVPEISLSEFFKFIENSLGCALFVDEVYKKVSLMFWNEALTSNPVKALDGNMEDNEGIVFSERKTIKLTSEKETSVPVTGTIITYNEILKKYGNPTYVKDYDELHQVNVAGFYYVKSVKYFIHGEPNPDWLFFSSLLAVPDTLDYYSDDGEKEEKNCGFKVPLTIPNVLLKGKTERTWHIKSSIAYVEDTGMYSFFYAISSKQGENTYNLFERIPYINSKRHLNSIIQTTSKNNNTNEESVKTEKEKDEKLLIIPCFSAGYYDSITYRLGSIVANLTELNMVRQGTPFKYTNSGNTWNNDFDFSLLTIYNKFWKDYDAVLQSSFHEISGRARLNIADIMNLSFDRPYTITGQKVLLESIQYEISDSGIEVVELKVKTIKVYE